MLVVAAGMEHHLSPSTLRKETDQDFYLDLIPIEKKRSISECKNVFLIGFSLYLDLSELN